MSDINEMEKIRDEIGVEPEISEADKEAGAKKFEIDPTDPTIPKGIFDEGIKNLEPKKVESLVKTREAGQEILENYKKNERKYFNRDMKTPEDFFKVPGVKEVVTKYPEIFKKLAQENFDMADFAWQMMHYKENALNYLDWYEDNEKKPDLLEGKKLNQDINFDQLAAVHMTRYCPENGIIKTHGSVSEENENKNYVGRESIHFNLNGVVTGGFEGAAGWDAMPFAIVTPLESMKDRVVDLYPVDTWVIGDFKIPENSVIVVDRSQFSEMDIPNRFGGVGPAKVVFVEGKMQETVNGLLTEKGYTVQESSTWNWHNTEMMVDGNERILPEYEDTKLMGQFADKKDIPLSKAYSATFNNQLERTIALKKFHMKSLESGEDTADDFFMNIPVVAKHLRNLDSLASNIHLDNDESKKSVERLRKHSNEMIEECLHKFIEHLAQKTSETPDRKLQFLMGIDNDKIASFNFNYGDTEAKINLENYDMPQNELEGLLVRLSGEISEGWGVDITVGKYVKDDSDIKQWREFLEK